MPSAKAVACPYCGSKEFEICGYIFYRQPYDGAKREYGESDLHWDCVFPELVECRNCQNGVTTQFVKRGILEALFEVKERKLRKR